MRIKIKDILPSPTHKKRKKATKRTEKKTMYVKKSLKVNANS